MVKSGQPTAAPQLVTFRNPSRPAAQLETFPLSQLFPRAPAEHWTQLQRTDFHVWVVFTRGSCRHMVDFAFVRCQPGTVLHIRPGQVHRWEPSPGLEGHVLVMTPALMPPVPTRQKVPLYQRFIDDDAWPSAVNLPPAHRRRVTGWFAQLDATVRESDDSEVSTELERHLISVALLDVFRSCKGEPAAPAGADALRIRRLRSDLERSYRVTRNVHDYAAALPCSAKTLDRTCRKELGMSAKAFIDARVVLEARRYLAYTDDTVEHIGANLGFTEPTNFVKFFKARTRSSPGAFRRQFRAEAAKAPPQPTGFVAAKRSRT